MVRHAQVAISWNSYILFWPSREGAIATKTNVKCESDRLETYRQQKLHPIGRCRTSFCSAICAPAGHREYESALFSNHFRICWLHLHTLSPVLCARWNAGSTFGIVGASHHSNARNMTCTVCQHQLKSNVSGQSAFDTATQRFEEAGVVA